jgi:hypothetical protein
MKKMRTPARLLLALTAALPAAAAADEAGPRRERVVLSERYRRGWLHELLLGRDYRDLWATPIEVEVLDLRREAGGLTPVRVVGSGQTKGLALKGADGRSYTFRGLEKDLSRQLPPSLRESLAADILSDQAASQHPAGALVVPPILDAVGVLHNEPRFVVMPDDPALAEFRAGFAGAVGTFEEFPTAGFAGSVEIISAGEMWKRLRDGPEVRADARSYLLARLVDLMIGDWDRHRNQWRWAKLPGEPRWRPIPEDRDQAFVRFEGLLLAFARGGLPLLVAYGPTYPSMAGLAYDSWDVDRRILAELPREAYEEAAAFVGARVTDEVLGDAVDRMPPEYRARDGGRLLAALRARRDGIGEAARRFYEYLAPEVDVFATDAAEVVEVERARDGSVAVRVAAPPAAPYFERRFLPRETREVRLYLFGGDDRVVVRGPESPIKLRVVGGDGDDWVDDAAGGTLVYDSGSKDRVVRGPGTSWKRKPYTPPPPPPRGAWMPARDWGRRTMGTPPWIRYRSGVGLFVGAGLQTEGYAFRRHPYGDRQMIRGGYATEAKRVRIEYSGDFRFENSPLRAGIFARASGIDILRFYGYGNETPKGSKAFHRVERQQYSLEPSLTLPLGSRAAVSVGPVVKYATTELEPGRFITAVRPYGTDRFGQWGVAGAVRFDSADLPANPRRGAVVTAGGAFYPAAWDVESAFGSAYGEAAAYLGARKGLEPTLALRAGAKRVFGTYPFHEAAFVGGGSAIGAGSGDSGAVRGLPPQRYAGDACAYGSAELRLFLTRFFVLFPGDLGVFGLADAGRVWLDGESSKRWHRGFGGGVWIAFVERKNTVSFAVARSEGRTGVYFDAGFAF